MNTDHQIMSETRHLNQVAFPRICRLFLLGLPNLSHRSTFATSPNVALLLPTTATSQIQGAEYDAVPYFDFHLEQGAL